MAVSSLNSIGEEQSPILRLKPAKRASHYLTVRDFLIRDNKVSGISVNTDLSKKERDAGYHLESLRAAYVSQFMPNNALFPPARNFALVRPEIKTNGLYQLFRCMPKGANLHLHGSTVGRAEWLITNASYRANCYLFTNSTSGKAIEGAMRFFPGSTNVPSGYSRLSELRKGMSKKKREEFDDQLLKSITMGPHTATSDDPWQEFGNCLARMYGLVSYVPVFTNYLADAFETLIDDKIYHAEIRVGLRAGLEEPIPSGGTNLFHHLAVLPLVDESGTIIRDPLSVYTGFQDYYQTVRSNFSFKLISIDSKNSNDIKPSIKSTFAARQTNGDFVIGYDLVERETLSNQLVNFTNDWLRLVPRLIERHQVSFPYYFHAGESNWTADRNLFDAVLLGSKRIGHGYNLFAFPDLIDPLVERRIPLEVCAISNQLLHYIDNLQNHPASGYLRQGVQVVLGSDNPSMFQNTGLSYDYWSAYLAWNLSLSDVKRIAISSIVYSGMSSKEKSDRIKEFETDWEEFVDHLLTDSQSDQ